MLDHSRCNGSSPRAARFVVQRAAHFGLQAGARFERTRRGLCALGAVCAAWLVAGCGDSDSSGAGGSNSGGSAGSSAGGSAGSTNGGSAGSNSGGNGGTNSGGNAGSAGSAGGASTPLSERIQTHEVSVPGGVQAGVSNWRIWGRGSLNVAPVFTVPRGDCSSLVCYTTEAGAAQLVHVAGDGTLVSSAELAPGRQCRGLAAGPDGSFAALLWDDAGDRIFLHRYSAEAVELSPVTELTNADNRPDDFGIGESRLEYGAGRYGAYYHVHSDSGHEGDTLKWIDSATGAESTGWGWGCSHSMSNLLRFNPALMDFMPACVTDCYPGTPQGEFSAVAQGGIFLNHRQSKVLDVDAGCNGNVAGELGGAALSPGGYKLVFNAHQAPLTPGQSGYQSKNQDIGFASIGGDLSSAGVVWLTDTPSVDEADSSIARWQPAGGAAEEYVVGYAVPSQSGYQYLLGRVDPNGAWLEGPLDVSAQVAWGRRDDPFRVDANGDVIWAWFDAPGSTTMKLGRIASGSACE